MHPGWSLRSWASAQSHGEPDLPLCSVMVDLGLNFVQSPRPNVPRSGRGLWRTGRWLTPILGDAYGQLSYEWTPVCIHQSCSAVWQPSWEGRVIAEHPNPRPTLSNLCFPIIFLSFYFYVLKLKSGRQIALICICKRKINMLMITC